MKIQSNKLVTRARRVNRIRSRISGTPERPRLTVRVSNLHITAQVIDDTQGKTLAYASTIGKKASDTMTEKAAVVGAEIAKAAKAAKVNQVVFDRAGKRYHGRVKALADAARQAGLEF